MQDFRKLKVWGKAIDLLVLTYRATQGFPKSELFGLTNQLRRSCQSIIANIAEGCGHGGRGEFQYFLNVALGSACEMEALIMASGRLGFWEKGVENRLLDALIEVRRMIYGLRESLGTRNS